MKAGLVLLALLLAGCAARPAYSWYDPKIGAFMCETAPTEIVRECR